MSQQQSQQQQAQQEKNVVREFLPYLVHIVWPVLIIAFIAKSCAPSTY